MMQSKLLNHGGLLYQLQIAGEIDRLLRNDDAPSGLLVVEGSPSSRFGQIKQARGPRQFLLPEMERHSSNGLSSA